MRGPTVAPQSPAPPSFAVPSARALGAFVVSATGILLAAAGVAAEEPSRRPTIEVSAERVGRFARIDFVIGLDAEPPEARPRSPRPRDPRPRSPYDPDAMDVAIEIEAPGGGRVSVPAFWYQGHERLLLGEGDRTRDWIYPVGAPVWRARFAPVEVGTHAARARVRDVAGERLSEPVRFECVPSDRKGFVRVSARDPRFLELTGGEPFFPVGQNLAFIGEGQHVKLWRAEEIFRKLAANGANYLRIWTCCEDWALAIEARKSAWGRSWSGELPVVPAPGAADGGGERERAPERRCVELSGARKPVLEVAPVHPLAVRPSTRYRISGRVRCEEGAEVHLEIDPAIRGPLFPRGEATGWTPFERELTTGGDQRFLTTMRLRLEGEGRAWIDGLSLRELSPPEVPDPPEGPELLGDADVNRPVPGTYDQLDAFALDRLVDAAEENGIRLQLCLITRDLYMPHLAREGSPEYRRATEAAKKLLRYAVARWGYSTSVATWEYFNEMDPGRPTGRFYDELGEFLERTDPYRHLRATSAWGPSPRDWGHPRLDVADMHFYVRPDDEKKYPSEVDALLDRARFLRENAPAKPALLSEFGLATAEWRLRSEMRNDGELVHFHNALWASALSGLSGTALFWWWEELDRMGVYPRYRALAEFVRRIPFGAARLEPIAATAAVGPDGLRVVGLQAPAAAYAWLFDPRGAWIPSGRSGLAPTEVREARLELRGLAGGTYRAVWWDTRTAHAVREEVAATDGEGKLQLEAPGFIRDVALELTKTP